MPDTPHFALPFRFVNGHAAEVEQDTVEDIAACVEAVLRTRPGERDELPEFGTPDLTFTQRPVDTDALLDAVEEWEPRARLLVEERPDLFDETVARVRVAVDTEE